MGHVPSRSFSEIAARGWQTTDGEFLSAHTSNDDVTIGLGTRLITSALSTHRPDCSDYYRPNLRRMTAPISFPINRILQANAPTADRIIMLGVVLRPADTQGSDNWWRALPVRSGPNRVLSRPHYFLQSCNLIIHIHRISATRHVTRASC